MSWINDKGFWADTAERVLSSAGQGIVAGAGLEGIVSAMQAEGASTSLDLAGLAMSAGIGAVLMAVLTFAKCLATAGVTAGNPSIAQVSTPASQIVEKLNGSKVVAGAANEAVPSGTAIRDAGSLSAVE